MMLVLLTLGGIKMQIAKRCKLCAHKLLVDGSCSNPDCISHVIDDINRKEAEQEAKD